MCSLVSHRFLARQLFSAKIAICNSYTTTTSKLPIDFGQDDIGKLYDVPFDVASSLNFHQLFPSGFMRQLLTFRECVWLYREQTHKAFDALRAMEHVNARPLRVVLWGKFGTGKSITLHQMVHLAHTRDFVLLTAEDAMLWNRDNYHEIQGSVYKSARVNSPWWATRLLKNFKQQNSPSWQKIAALKTTKRYQWSQVENTPLDKPLTDVVEMGLSAPHLATDCFGALCRELRVHASSGEIKLLVGIDRANSLYGKCVVKRPDRTRATCDDLALNIFFRKFLMPIWSNGICVLVADKAEISDSRDPLSIPVVDPHILFGNEGFEQIDPFVSVETKLYTEAEFNAVHEYYLEKNWIKEEGPNAADARKQLMYLSARNPHYYERLCATNFRIGCVQPEPIH